MRSATIPATRRRSWSSITASELNGGMDWDFTNQHYQFNAGFFYDASDHIQLFFTGGRGFVMQDGAPSSAPRNDKLIFPKESGDFST